MNTAATTEKINPTIKHNKTQLKRTNWTLLNFNWSSI